jgi:hypothetical protein
MDGGQLEVMANELSLDRSPGHSVAVSPGAAHCRSENLSFFGGCVQQSLDLSFSLILVLGSIEEVIGTLYTHTRIFDRYPVPAHNPWE